MTITIVIYLRVSTKEQNTDIRVSFQLQLEICLQWINANYPGSPVQVVEEIGSAFHSSQPMLTQAMSILRNTGGGLLVCAFPDRLSRRVENFTNLLIKAKKNKVEIVTIQPEVYRTSRGTMEIAQVHFNLPRTPVYTGDTEKMRQAVYVAEMESRQKGLRLSEAYQYRIRSAVEGYPYHPGKVPYGFRRVEITRQDGTTYKSIELDPGESRNQREIALSIFQKLTHLSLEEALEEVCKDLDFWGSLNRGKPWNSHMLDNLYRKYLSNICCEKCKICTDDIMLCEGCMKGMHVGCYGKEEPQKYYCEDCSQHPSLPQKRMRGVAEGSQPPKPHDALLRNLEDAYNIAPPEEKERLLEMIERLRAKQ